jgi:PTH1 family peptidyl-tRNA hydrolase
MTLIVGLGNPGAEYASTRHNIGFMVIDELLRRNEHQDVSKSSFQGETFKSKKNIYLKPMTYMNLSGKSILKVKNFYKINKVIVIHDDLDLPFHNGLKSTDSVITKEYIRVRMGIGRPKNKGEVSSFVLSSFSQEEEPFLAEWISKAADAVEEMSIGDWEKVASLHSIKKLNTQKQ